MSRRVSWEVIEGCSHTYYDRRYQAIDHIKEARDKGHLVEMHRWQLIGDETSSQPVDLEALLAKKTTLQNAPDVHQETRIEMPAAVWADVVQALNF